VPGAAGRTGEEQSGAHVGPADAHHGERGPAVDGVGGHHDHGVALEIDPLEQGTEELVGAADGLLTLAHRLGLRRERLGVLGPHHVGRLDQHGRSPSPELPEGPHHRLVVVAGAVGRLRILDEQVPTHHPPLDQAVAVHQPDARLASEVDHVGPLAVVPVGDDRSADAAVLQRVAQGTDLGPVEQPVVDLRHRHDAEVEDLAQPR
jgi:hypothetical protein